VIAPGKRRPQAGFKLRTTRHLDPRDVTTHDGIPVTTMARTLVDLTNVLTPHQLANVIHEAAYHELFDRQATRASTASNKRSTRTEPTRQATARTGSSPSSPTCPNRWSTRKIEGLEVDFAWPDLVVEIDGRPRTQREDRRRDAILGAS
jgi:hypothetical protein